MQCQKDYLQAVIFNEYCFIRFHLFYMYILKTIFVEVTL